MLPHGVGILRLFCLRTGLIHFAHFGLQSRMVFEGTTGVYERIYHVNSKWVRKKEKHANSKWIWRMFCLCSYLSNDSNFCPQARSKMGMDCRSLVWKRSWKITFFGPISRQDLKNQLAPPPPPTKNSQEFPPVTHTGLWALLMAYLRKCPPGTFDIVICEKHMLSYLLN